MPRFGATCARLHFAANSSPHNKKAKAGNLKNAAGILKDRSTARAYPAAFEELGGSWGA
jgi:dihydroorotase